GNPLMLEAHNAAMFVTDGVKMKLILRENATIYETLHELMHMRDCQQIGMKAFMQKSLVEREKFVYDKMVEYQKYLNRKELEHAKWYINDRYHKYGVTDNLGNPIKETLPSNLDDIPKKRQKVNLDIILNLK
ncbi:zincin-like metallopeptidase toxin domain-containing protein, partial [Chryseobacterium sp.]|uniref:zincin-like metallopeptidase toxin domain-containing protein n=3 Tax=Chryseobacterium TaxID=59732 RepID=UPI00289E43D6